MEVAAPRRWDDPAEGSGSHDTSARVLPRPIGPRMTLKTLTVPRVDGAGAVCGSRSIDREEIPNDADHRGRNLNCVENRSDETEFSGPGRRSQSASLTLGTRRNGTLGRTGRVADGGGCGFAGTDGWFVGGETPGGARGARLPGANGFYPVGVLRCAPVGTRRATYHKHSRPVASGSQNDGRGAASWPNRTSAGWSLQR